MKTAVCVSVLLGALLWQLGSGLTLEAFENPMPSRMPVPVKLGSDRARSRRQTGPLEMNQPFRVLPVYADNFAANIGEKATLVENDIIPRLLDFLQQSLSVAPLSGPILLNNNCTTNLILRDADTGAITCGQRCAPTFCGSFQVPPEHLKQCRECDTARMNIDLADCVPGTPAEDGPGVSGYDFLLYITAEQTQCPQAVGGAQTVAFATACQTEAVQDRPIAGTINFCPEGVNNRDPEFAFAVSKHEILHALGFSSFLFALWRDPATNEPRTPRLDSSGLPAVMEGNFVVSSTTVQTVTYSDWQTANGVISRQVSQLVTPAVRAEARSHFDCPTLLGVELEDQGGTGTAGQHWEKRVLGNEAMTGQVTFNPVFSRFTFAALEDSGWYSVNYSLADDFVWGQGAGCRFAEGSCGEWIATQQANDQPLTPFCATLESTSPLSLSCTADREALSRCNLISQSDIPAEYQYFSTEVGGRVIIADYCPFQDVFNFQNNDGSLRGTTCSVAGNTPPSNTLLQSYGSGARCVNHGRQWRVNNQPQSVYGAGCYQYSCTDDAVSVTIGNQQFSCSCSQAGEEREFDMKISGVQYQGSILCPPCNEICHAPSKGIVLGESLGENEGSGPVTEGKAPPTHSHTPFLFSLAVLVLLASML